MGQQFLEISGGKQMETLEVEEEEKREKWGSKWEFLLSCIGYSVGLGNIWRFPYLVYKNGGGAFLIPYFIMLIFCGLPMYYMEVAIGQFFERGPVQCMRAMCPLFVGVGYAMMMVSFLVAVYYNVIISWVLFYLFDSFRSNIPWESCNSDWDSPNCNKRAKIGNGTIYNASLGINICLPDFKLIPIMENGTLTKCIENSTERFSAAEEYWNHNVLDITGGIDDAGDVRWQLALCLLAGWTVVYFCMWKGIKSVGKVVYFTATFPYIVLFILLIRGVTLEGAGNGVKFYLEPDIEKLLEPGVWKDAATQLFYSLGVAFGSLISMASYNQFRNNCLRDAVLIACIDSLTSTLAGIVIFSVLGYMAHTLDVDIDKVVASGPGLAFIVYPEGIAAMPIPTLWAILFFFMLFTLGLDSEFAMMECVITNLVDEYPKIFRKRKEFLILAVCIVAYLIGLSNVTQGGMFVFNLFDYQSGGVSLLFIAACEVIAVGWFFGSERMRRYVHVMTGIRPSICWSVCWQLFTPALLTAVFIYILVKWEGVSYDEKAYPDWAEVVGWLLACASMGMIPLFMFIGFLTETGSISERFKKLTTPDEELITRILRKNDALEMVSGYPPTYTNKAVEA